MKASEFKNIIKSAMKEAIQEELKTILLEAVKSNNTNRIVESKDTYAQPHIENPRKLTSQERQKLFGGILNDIKDGNTITSAYSGEVQIPQNIDTINQALPDGNLGIDTIMGLLNA